VTLAHSPSLVIHWRGRTARRAERHPRSAPDEARAVLSSVEPESPRGIFGQAGCGPPPSVMIWIKSCADLLDSLYPLQSAKSSHEMRPRGRFRVADRYNIVDFRVPKSPAPLSCHPGADKSGKRRASQPRLRRRCTTAWSGLTRSASVTLTTLTGSNHTSGAIPVSTQSVLLTNNARA
jgi:hypothetical protein